MRLSLKSWRPDPAKERADRAGLKARIERIFGLGETDVVVVNEIACLDPGCADVETVILVMRTGEPTRAVKSASPMAEITDIEIECLAAVWKRLVLGGDQES
jgi:hypothetical protein